MLSTPPRPWSTFFEHHWGSKSLTSLKMVSYWRLKSLDVEVLSVLRRAALCRKVDEQRALRDIEDLDESAYRSYSSYHRSFGQHGNIAKTKRL